MKPIDSSVRLNATVTSSDAPTQTAPRVASESDGGLLPDALGQLQCSGDPGAMLAALTMATAKQQKDTARQQRNEAMTAMEKADAAQIQDMRDKANLQRAQGIVDGVTQMAQGACDLGAGLNEAHAASEQAQASADEADLRENSKAYSDEHVSALQTSANALNQGAASSKTDAAWDHFGSSAFGAARSVADGFFAGAMTDKDADAKMHETSAATYKQIADNAHDTENDAKALLNKALDFYKEYVDTKNQTAMAAIHRA